MARQRRGGLRPPELRGTLGTLLRTAVPAVRDVLERGAREGRARLDDALSGRRRNDALAELGEIVLDLIRRGEIDIAELPEVQDIVAHLDEVDAGHDNDHAPPAPPPPARAPGRKRFDDRSAGFDPKRTIDQRPRGRRPADDDTVSSRTWSPPRAAAPAQPGRVWRPTNPAAATAERPADETTARERASAPKKGGISFDDDDSDLAEYMHPDDVPPKNSDD